MTWAVSHPFSDEEADLTPKSPAGRAPLGSRPSNGSSRRLGLLTSWAISPGYFPEGWTQGLSLPGPPPTSHPEPLLGPLLTASQGRRGPTLAEPPAHPPANCSHPQAHIEFKEQNQRQAQSLCWGGLWFPAPTRGLAQGPVWCLLQEKPTAQRPPYQGTKALRPQADPGMAQWELPAGLKLAGSLATISRLHPATGADGGGGWLG